MRRRMSVCIGSGHVTLRMEQVASQLPGLLATHVSDAEAAAEGIRMAGECLDGWATDSDAADARIIAAMANENEPFALAGPEALTDTFAAGDPGPVTVVASDGSSISPDRFVDVRCYVVNTGHAVIPYRVPGEPALGAIAVIGLEDADGDALANVPAPPLPGVAVQLFRDVLELETGIDLAIERAEAGPVVLLGDGTLLPWDLSSPQVPAHVAAAFQGRTGHALDRLRAAGESISVGAYVSRSAAGDIARSLRALAATPSRQWPRSDAAIFRDRLPDGHRTALFRAKSNNPRRVEQRLRDHPVAFFYMRTGDDIARVELPEWAASPVRVARLHAAIADQCRRCDGYPRALQEAHEQAVISGADREQFARLLAGQAMDFGVPISAGGKRDSKRRRAL